MSGVYNHPLYQAGGLYVRADAPKLATIDGQAPYIENIGNIVPVSQVYIVPCDTLFL